MVEIEELVENAIEAGMGSPVLLAQHLTPICRGFFQVQITKAREAKTKDERIAAIRGIVGEIDERIRTNRLKMQEARVKYLQLSTRGGFFEETRRGKKIKTDMTFYRRRLGGLTVWDTNCLSPVRKYWEEELERELGLEYIGRDAHTERRIFYIPSAGKYVEVDKEGNVSYESKILEVEETISIETPEGHDAPFVAEVTTRTKVDKLTKKALEGIEKRIQSQLGDYFKSLNANLSEIKGEPLKIGAVYRIRTDKNVSMYPISNILIERKEPKTANYPITGTDVVNLREGKLVRHESRVVIVKKKKEEEEDKNEKEKRTSEII